MLLQNQARGLAILRRVWPRTLAAKAVASWHKRVQAVRVLRRVGVRWCRQGLCTALRCWSANKGDFARAFSILAWHGVHWLIADRKVAVQSWRRHFKNQVLAATPCVMQSSSPLPSPVVAPVCSFRRKSRRSRSSVA